jgi:formylglycine-generating enzyme required for sulfatase activity
MNDREISKCPGCGKDIQPGWKICPFCETRLLAMVCPLCGSQVQPDWRRCPHCEALLVCPQCAARIPQAMTHCPTCRIGRGVLKPPTHSFVEEICGMEMVHVPAGAFEMGDLFGDGLENELPVHRVRLDAFHIGRWPVTQDQWLRLKPENPSRFEGGDLPVEQVTWEDARDFARELTLAHEGRYRFELPTEAQWEYAARSGGRTELYAGGDDIGKMAWYEDNSNGRTHPVGAKMPNGLGLYDMSGNVWEWCTDTFKVDAYVLHSDDNPSMTAGGADRVIRGGSWNLDAWSARCSRRFSFRADMFGAGLGFRLVMVAGDAGGGMQ